MQTQQQLPRADPCIDTALFLASKGLGVFSPFGVNGDIFIEHSPTEPTVKTVLYQQGGLQRPLKYLGDIRRPILHIEVTHTSRMQLKQKLGVIASTLDQVTYSTDYSHYFYRLQAEPTTWKVSESEFRGSVNFLVTHTIINSIEEE